MYINIYYKEKHIGNYIIGLRQKGGSVYEVSILAKKGLLYDYKREFRDIERAEQDYEKFINQYKKRINRNK